MYEIGSIGFFLFIYKEFFIVEKSTKILLETHVAPIKR